MFGHINPYLDSSLPEPPSQPLVEEYLCQQWIWRTGGVLRPSAIGNSEVAHL